ncbi:hypothetical protein ACL6C3_19155 [Capilliphycus salinus ALCB114379]|uniref:hypothetical protein n=1 Tax=Capilliphycus salinus TaxID=2768948 RepID=UPI0039A672F2
MRSDVKRFERSFILHSESIKPFPSGSSSLWEAAWNAIAKGDSWSFFLVGIGSFSSVIYPHVPLVGFAAVTGNTLPRKKAIFTALMIWFANQLYGFTIRQYPQTKELFTWGLVMGIGTIIVTGLITLRPRFSRINFWGYLIWLIVAIVGGYALFEGSIVLIADLMGGHGFTAEILWRIFVKDAVWAMSLSAIHSLFMGLIIQTVPSQSGYRPPGCGQKF